MSKLSPSGHYSPLRYPGGKGKLARFVADLVRANSIVDGVYVEPYAGGAAVAIELLLTGLVRRIEINDLNVPVYSFWNAILNDTQNLIHMIETTPINLHSRALAKQKLKDGGPPSTDLAFAMFFLNRTNRSGILNGGVIGGKSQTGPWKIDARYNKEDLIRRIRKIALYKNKVSVSNMDAIDFLREGRSRWSEKTLVYLDPPYYEKGRDLYYNYYKYSDHKSVAEATREITTAKWIVSYDDVLPIHELYDHEAWLQYTIGYSARAVGRGREAMFFSPSLIVPDVAGSMVELARSDDLSYIAPNLRLAA